LVLVLVLVLTKKKSFGFELVIIISKIGIEVPNICVNQKIHVLSLVSREKNTDTIWEPC
jgi:hypothetical protein